MKNDIPDSYLQLIEQAGSYNPSDFPVPNGWLSNFGKFSLSLHAQAPVFFIVDFAKNKYLYMDPSCKSVVGYDRAELQNAGPLFFVSLWHPDDFKICNEKILPEVILFLKNEVNQNVHQYSFSYNYRIKIKNGSYITLLQRSTYYLHPTEGHPLASVGFVIDISHFKTDNSIVFTIEKMEEEVEPLSNSTTVVHKSVYQPDVLDFKISKREVDVLLQMYQGFSSKEIAIQLNLSLHTVNNHRKNMLERTGCKNASELINYALKSGLL